MKKLAILAFAGLLTSTSAVLAKETNEKTTLEWMNSVERFVMPVEFTSVALGRDMSNHKITLEAQANCQAFKLFGQAETADGVVIQTAIQFAGAGSLTKGKKYKVEGISKFEPNMRVTLMKAYCTNY